jgi:3-oxoacyl-[acyl-carrier protein] reductase
MDLYLKNKTFIVLGATSGFGEAVTRQLIKEDAYVLAVARGEEKLTKLHQSFPEQTDVLKGDVTQSGTLKKLMQKVENKPLSGILVNAAGPPAKTFLETSLEDWDDAYHKLVRWKIELTKLLLPKFLEQQYGRFLFIESSAIKQPLENLVLSTSMRLSVAGFVKTLSQEIPDKGITFNLIAPGYHYTPAVERLIKKKAENMNTSEHEARSQIEEAIPMKKTGNINHFASLAAWLLSPLSDYVSGQVYAIDGGTIRATL